ncbi:MAG: hypothetical protein A2233_04065 [Candidatus Kerfeldbacteria bacterium RIFOXYA2_FULL_38_24]|uniref:Dipeptidylpeptidase IV N-terminal domain-containing protein n=1 Tax=Candidatus Kerfeldbacteria bacterium RIFOXYB2_FULL_38_14 TaxID=1798547 RepID=A0A1G2BBY9_9BACT|nr:MAG: hypothetical protein A2233_04065 [Candidatus Kerfeldbacteria bacterium RIFOXYA2_FULL_38_24]OGY86743.1 MAG: hypothetical protein A2319_00800 [Candidatus Kerfeldbacteria bacterium RIFOXYB2_FULL_38_14]OGY90082.1 MAG: hypothetical protein A2458_00915 [Candidatus Kerfeldbacteria bacterium RIFOXYC2_FULL_38_9]
MVFSRKLKIILEIVGFILAIILIAFLLYLVFFKSTATPPAEPNVNNANQNTNAGLPGVNNANVNIPANYNTNGEQPTQLPGVDNTANGGLTKTEIITPDINTQNPEMAGDGSVRYYNPDDGKFYNVDNNGNISEISKLMYQGVSQVTWANNANQAILEFPDQSNVFVDLKTNKQTTLPKEFQDFTFSPDAKQIAFKYLSSDPEKNVLAIASPDGSGARTIEPLGENEDITQVDWSPTGKVVATWTEFIDANRQEIGFVGLNDENFKGVVVHGYGLQTQYSPDGQRLLYSTFSADSNYNPTVSIVDANGDDIGKNNKDLELNTFARKCSFSADNAKVYCGIPKEQKYGYGLEPSILRGTTDDIYEVDLKNGTKKRIAVPVDAQGNPAYAVNKMFVAQNGQYLYFRDEQSGQLVKISL